MIRLALGFLIAIGLTVQGHAQETPYAEGQVWAYKNTPEDPGSLIRIQEIDTTSWAEEGVTIYHISMIGIVVTGLSETVPVRHMPVSKETLDASVTRLTKTSEQFPEYRAGKAEWERANGGVFTITLAQIADFVRNQMATQIERQGGG